MNIIDLTEAKSKFRENSKKWLDMVGNGQFREANEFARSTYIEQVLSPNVEGTPSAGGYLAPEEWDTQLHAIIRKNSVILRQVNFVDMKSNIFNAGTLASYPSANWTDENTTITTSKPTFGQAQLTAKKLAAIIPASNEFFQDSSVPVLQMYMELIGEVFAEAIDIECFRAGSVLDAILGCTDHQVVYQGGSSTSGLLKYSEIEWDDIFNLVNTPLPPKAMFGAGIYVDQNVFNVLMKKKTATTLAYLMTPMSAPGSEPSLDPQDDMLAPRMVFEGFPIYVLPSGTLIETYDTNDHSDTPHVIFGNLRRTTLGGNRGGTELRVSHDATAEGVNAFTNDLLMHRWTKRMAFKVTQGSYIAQLHTAVS